MPVFVTMVMKMRDWYKDVYNCERSVELPFAEFFVDCCDDMDSHVTDHKFNILDVGGVPSDDSVYYRYKENAKKRGFGYHVCDFRNHGYTDYMGDFVTLDFGGANFDAILFLSSIEHFAQCTEGDMRYRDGYDRVAFLKAMSLIRKPYGIIGITVPFNQQYWCPYHQNYDFKGIMELSAGTKIKHGFIYKNVGDLWVRTNVWDVSGLRYGDGKATSVGMFIFEVQQNGV